MRLTWLSYLVGGFMQSLFDEFDEAALIRFLLHTTHSADSVDAHVLFNAKNVNDNKFASFFVLYPSFTILGPVKFVWTLQRDLVGVHRLIFVQIIV